jgi:hypothetical protein
VVSSLLACSPARQSTWGSRGAAPDAPDESHASVFARRNRLTGWAGRGTGPFLAGTPGAARGVHECTGALIRVGCILPSPSGLGPTHPSPVDPARAPACTRSPAFCVFASRHPSPAASAWLADPAALTGHLLPLARPRARPHHHTQQQNVRLPQAVRRATGNKHPTNNGTPARNTTNNPTQHTGNSHHRRAAHRPPTSVCWMRTSARSPVLRRLLGIVQGTVICLQLLNATLPREFASLRFYPAVFSPSRSRWPGAWNNRGVQRTSIEQPGNHSPSVRYQSTPPIHKPPSAGKNRAPSPFPSLNLGRRNPCFASRASLPQLPHLTLSR